MPIVDAGADLLVVPAAPRGGSPLLEALERWPRLSGACPEVLRLSPVEPCAPLPTVLFTLLRAY